MLKTLLKLCFSFALVYWLIASGKLDFSLVQTSISRGPFWAVTISLMLIQVAMGTYRYKILLEAKSSQKIPYFHLLKLNWIGLFFSSLLPGAVTGDLIKLVYIKKLDHHFSKTFLVTSALLDRILGLFGLLSLSTFFGLLYYFELVALSPQMKHVIAINGLLFFATFFFLSLLFLKKKWQSFFIRTVERFPFLGKKVATMAAQIFSLREKAKDIFICYFISLIVQFISILSFWILCSPFTGEQLPFPYAFSLIPIGLIAIAVPISPAGLGVGHALFQNLFMFLKITNGASLFNLFFLCNLFVNLLGSIPYIFIGKKAHLTESP